MPAGSLANELRWFEQEHWLLSVDFSVCFELFIVLQVHFIRQRADHDNGRIITGLLDGFALKLQHRLSSFYGFARLLEQLKELTFKSNGIDARMQQDLCA